MKLKKILIASLALLAFASCSKDNGSDPVPPAPKQPVDAVLSFLVTANPTTKAETEVDSNAGAKERDVRSLNAYVFNEGGQLIGSSRAEAKVGEENLTKIDSILIKIVPGDNDGPSTETFKLVVLANVEDIKASSLSDLQGKTLTETIGKYGIGAVLPMNSKVIEFSGVRPSVKEEGKESYIVNNWIVNGGGPVTEKAGQGLDKEIELNRMVARVQVESVTMAISDRYPGASFRLDTISMVNVRSQAKLPTDGTLGAIGAIGTGVFVKGYQSSQYKEATGDEKNVIVPAKADKSDLVPTLWKSYTFGAVEDGEIFNDTNVGDLSEKNFCCYIFPNEKKTETTPEPHYETALLLSGYFKRREGDTPELKHYMVKLNDEGTINVLANNIYKLSIILNGEGSSDENHPEITAGVSVTIVVADWDVIEQTENDDNIPETN